MARSLFRLPWAEIAAGLGIVFGAWLIHGSFQSSGDTPSLAFLALGAVDILLCFGLLGYLLRLRLREGESLPRSWILAGAALLACFLGWNAALFVDADRLLADQRQHNQHIQTVARLEESLQHLGEAVADRATWQANVAEYAKAHQGVHQQLRAQPAWDRELMRVEDEVHDMQKLADAWFKELDAATPSAPPGGKVEATGRRGELQQAHRRALAHLKSLHDEIAVAERELAAAYRTRWHAVGASALTSVVLILGCLLFWLLFDRELRRTWKLQARLAGAESRFRWLVENQFEPIAVVDVAGNIHYVNPVWRTKFGYALDELQAGNLLARVHEDDRPRVLSSLRSRELQRAIPCRLKAGHGNWRDVELCVQPHEDSGIAVVRLAEVREAPVVPAPPPVLVDDEKLKETEARLAAAEQDADRLRCELAGGRADLHRERWLADAHRDANQDGVLILSAEAEALSWNQAFARMWMLSADTLAGHGWPTIAAHLQTQVQEGWDEFHQATGAGAALVDNCWEMKLEGERTLEVYVHALPDGAARFVFRDVTSQKSLEAQLRDEQLVHETELRERDKQLKQLDKRLRESETALRDQQDRLHQQHDAHEAHQKAMLTARASLRRLASGAANDVNSVLSVVIGNAEVLRDNLPPDHVAQYYLGDILQAAGRGTELTNRLLTFSRNHLMQPVPIEIHEALASLEPKLRVALGHVQFQWQRGSGALWIKTDPDPFEQALLSLAAHIKLHMPQSGTLTLRAARVERLRRDLPHAEMTPGTYVQIQLVDTATSIDDDTLPHVFEPYAAILDGQRGDLSLATAQGIIRQSGGSIAVERAPDQGNVWTILLPESSERSQELRASA